MRLLIICFLAAALAGCGSSESSRRIDDLESRVATLESEAAGGSEVAIVLAKFWKDEPMFVVPDGSMGRQHVCLNYKVAGTSQESCLEHWVGIGSASANRDANTQRLLDSGMRTYECFNSARVGEPVPGCWW